MIRLLQFVIVLMALGSVSAFAQFDYTPDTTMILREKFTKPFPTVWKTIKRLITEESCAVESEKQSFDEKTEMYKGNLRSETCILMSGEDSTRDVMMKYGKVPMIRGGVWVSGRIQYNFSIKDMPDKTVQVVLTVELSGREDYITSMVHFWSSNGILETKMMEKLKKALGGS